MKHLGRDGDPAVVRKGDFGLSQKKQDRLFQIKPRPKQGQGLDLRLLTAVSFIGDLWIYHNRRSSAIDTGISNKRGCTYFTLDRCDFNTGSSGIA